MVVNEDFIRDEDRNGFFVSKETKRIWACEIHILECFISICEKNQLKWFMIAGSLLGAIRHKGFIPWDDDIDVAMPREDYDRFTKIASAYLPDYLFLQTALSDPGRGIGYAQLRDSRTSAIDLRYVDDNNRFNQGIFIDVFPMDAVAEKEEDISWQTAKLMNFNKIYLNAYRPRVTTLKEWIKKIRGRVLLKRFGLERVYEEREMAYKSISSNNSKLIGMVSFLYDEPRFQWNKEWFDEVIDVPFEYILVKVPKCYEEILTQTYGDWKQPVKGTAMHQGIDFSCDMPYTEYLVKKYGYSRFE